MLSQNILRQTDSKYYWYITYYCSKTNTNIITSQAWLMLRLCIPFSWLEKRLNVLASKRWHFPSYFQSENGNIYSSRVINLQYIKRSTRWVRIFVARHWWICTIGRKRCAIGRSLDRAAIGRSSINRRIVNLLFRAPAAQPTYLRYQRMQPFPSTVTCWKPKVVKKVNPTYCLCGKQDDGKLRLNVMCVVTVVSCSTINV